MGSKYLPVADNHFFCGSTSRTTPISRQASLLYVVALRLNSITENTRYGAEQCQTNNNQSKMKAIFFSILLFVAALNPTYSAQPLFAIGTSTANKNLYRSEEHTSELQSRFDLVCRLLLEK